MIRFLARGLFFSLMALLLASCDSANDSVNVPGLSGYTLTVQTTNATTGAAATQATAASPLRVVATLIPPPGTPVGTSLAGATITFSVASATSGADPVGRLGTAVAQTDGSGVASVILNAGTKPAVSAALITEDVTARFVDPNLNVASDTQRYTTTGDESATGGTGGGPTPTNVLRMTLSAIDGTGTPISATNPVTTADPGRLVVVVTLDGVAVPNAFVTFASPPVGALSQTTASTNASGQAEVSIEPLANGAGVASAVATYGSQQVSASTVIATAVNATAAVTLKLGNGTGTGVGGFTNSVLATSAVGAIALGSTVTITADVVVDPANTAYATPVNISFTSGCASLNPATAIIDASAATVNGRAVVTYRPVSCTDSDVITATLVDGTRTLTATVTLDIALPVVTQVVFDSVSPASGDLALAGTGGASRPSRAEVAFKVLSDTGSPVPNQLVCFGLSTSIGGLSVNSSARTNSSGIALAAVQAGSVPTSVRVLATVDSDVNAPGTTDAADCATLPNPALTTVSSALFVSTGLPDQNSFSLSFSVANPLAWESDDGTSSITVHAADHFNNPVPKDTAISFWTELGSIESACLTNSNGTCSVIWRAQSPRVNRDPRGGATIGVNQTVGRAINDRLGRSTIVAYAVGEESFNDADGDGRFDDVNANGVYNFGVDETIGNLAEVIKDSNENGVRDRPGLAFDVFEDEEFVDFDHDGISDPANTRYDGVLCAGATTACSGDATVNVRASGVLVMSSHQPRMYVFDIGAFNSSVIDYALDGTMTGIPAQIASIGIVPNKQSLRFVVTDINGNALPAGATITAVVAPGKAGTLSSATTSYTVPSQTEFYTGIFTVEPPGGTEISDGTLTITVDAGGIKTIAAVVTIDN